MNTLESVKNWGYSRDNNIFNSDYLFCRESQQYLSIIVCISKMVDFSDNFFLLIISKGYFHICTINIWNVIKAAFKLIKIYATQKFFHSYSILYTIHTYLYISVMLMIVLITFTKMYKLKSMWTIWFK